MSDRDTIRISSANLHDGGVDPDGATARREQSVTAVRDWRPHPVLVLVLVLELYAPGEALVRKHFRTLANATGLEPCALGLPRGSRQLRTAILADTSTLEILDDGPPVHHAPFWAEAVVRIRATRDHTDRRQRACPRHHRDRAAHRGAAAGDPDRPPRPAEHRRRRLELLHP
ncbi:MAG TPA: hypothetical protein VHZ03_26120 [Trebonia sp.]|jgi:hypothetical protein|nr:hypothetical protein [Trebonia sp.]